MIRLCTWCGDSFEPRGNGGKPQRFCSKDCRENFNTACRIWAVQEHEAERVSIFELRTAFYQHTRCVQRDLAPGGSRDAPEGREHPGGLLVNDGAGRQGDRPTYLSKEGRNNDRGKVRA